MDPDLVAGLDVTGIGMGMVFLSLILMMLVIWLLGRVFAVKGGAGPEGEAQVERVPVDVAAVTPRSDDRDEAAAIGVALAVAALSNRAAAPAAVVAEPEFDYGNVTGEIVSVIRVEPGPDNWSRQGRLSATL